MKLLWILSLTVDSCSVDDTGAGANQLNTSVVRCTQQVLASFEPTITLPLNNIWQKVLKLGWNIDYKLDQGIIDIDASAYYTSSGFE